MIFIDTGYLLALADDRDQLHARAMAWSNHVREPLLLTTAVLIEAFNGLSSSPLRGQMHVLHDAMRVSRQFRLLDVDDLLLERALDLHRDRSDKLWSLTDCIAFVVMDDHGIRRALSHDHHFEQAGFEALLRRDPP